MHLAFDEGVTFDHVKQLFNVMSSESFQIFPNEGQKENLGSLLMYFWNSVGQEPAIFNFL